MMHSFGPSWIIFGSVTLKNRALNPVAQLFIEAAREVTKPLARRN